MRKITFFISFLFLAFSSLNAQAPANDTCQGAIELTVFDSSCQSPTIADNTNATTSGVTAPSCASIGQGDLWYKITVPSSGFVTIETSGVNGSSVTDTGLAVYSGSCNSLTEIYCNDDGVGTGAFAKLELANLTAGDVLYVRLFFVYQDIKGEVNICAYNPQAAATPVYKLADELNIYPNPFNKKLNISSEHIIDEIHIYNITGQEVLKARPESSNFSFRTEKLQPGIYLVKVLSNHSTATLKLFKK